jgi:hypothetical protein
VHMLMVFAVLILLAFLFRDDQEMDRFWARIVKDPTLRSQVKLGARVGPAAVAGLFVLIAVLAAVFVLYKALDNPEMPGGAAFVSGFLGAMFFVLYGFGSLALLAALPAIVISAVSGAVLYPLVMRGLGNTALPAFSFPAILAVLICPLVVVPLAQGLYLTLFEFQTRNHLWFLATVLLLLTFAASWHVTSRTLSLSPFDWRGWLQPLNKSHSVDGRKIPGN